ncbi:hypothetical protein BH09ACT4_BH09ACT4_02190 [soil metagenome]
MFVITADQVDSRNQPDRAGEMMAELTRRLDDTLELPVDRTAGDEIQLLIRTAEATVTAVLALTRSGQWSVGCGLGEVGAPLPANVREAVGPAFVAARAAVEIAKKRETRFAVRGGDSAMDAEALTDLLLQLRGKRSSQGWELYDLLAAGATQATAAERLGISPQAASKRARAAGIRFETNAVPALCRLFGRIGADELAESGAEPAGPLSDAGDRMVS